MRWLDKLPRDVVESRLPLELLTIWTLFLHDRWDEATSLWHRAEKTIAGLAEPERSLRRGVWLAIGKQRPAGAGSGTGGGAGDGSGHGGDDW